MKSRIVCFIAFFVLIVGMIFVLYPFIGQVIVDRTNKQDIQTFVEKQETLSNQETSYLKTQMEAYNQRIFEQDQVGLCDVWDKNQDTFDFSEMSGTDGVIGYIAIDAMNIQLPLYLGESKDNMNQGAVVLAQTSMPIGGINTNCVIAAHRGWKGAAMFRDIEQLQLGDEVRITNLWETLTYQVIKIIVIDPADIQAVKILEGEDMVTLITCHPYTENRQRYVVYCRRINDEKNETLVIPFDGEAYVSSQTEIMLEKKVNYLALSIFVIILMGIMIWIIWRWRTRKKRSGHSERGGD